MIAKEKLKFKIELASTYWEKVPAFSILFNSKVINDRQIVWTPSGELFVVEFESEVEEGTKCELSIRLDNKEWTDTVQNEDKTAILKDMMLHIKRIEIDEIDLGMLIWNKCKFTPDSDSFPTLDNCVDLGWNGTWTLSFESPFYIWLLENI